MQKVTNQDVVIYITSFVLRTYSVDPCFNVVTSSAHQSSDDVSSLSPYYGQPLHVIACRVLLRMSDDYGRNFFVILVIVLYLYLAQLVLCPYFDKIIIGLNGCDAVQI